MSNDFIWDARIGTIVDIKQHLLNGVDINYQDQKGVTALMALAELGRLETMELVISHGANLDIQDEDGYTALMHACFHRKPDAVSLLLSVGADISLQSTINNNALHIAAHRCENSTVILLSHDIDIDVNAQNIQGNTPLTTACRHNRINPIKALLINGADVNIQNKNGKTPFTIACKYYYVDDTLLRLLLGHNPNFDIKDDEGNCVLDRLTKKNKGLRDYLAEYRENPDEYKRNYLTFPEIIKCLNSMNANDIVDEKNDGIIQNIMDNGLLVKTFNNIDFERQSALLMARAKYIASNEEIAKQIQQIMQKTYARENAGKIDVAKIKILNMFNNTLERL